MTEASREEQVEIRRAKATDAPALAELSRQLGYPTETAEAAGRLAEVLRAGDHAVFVATGPGGEVVGWTHVFVARRIESDPFAELGGFVVAEERRRRGVGRRLLDAAEAWAAAHGAAKLRVRTRIERDDALAFYQRQGFRPTKEQSVVDKPLPSRP